MASTRTGDQFNGSEIAITGMSGRFPGANSIDAFWQNLKNGVESTSFFTDHELKASGVNPAVLQDPNYVKAGGVLDDLDLFDAAFFGFTPREAELTDPQHRFFLECAWEALENAGYDSDTYEGSVGVYAGVSTNSYILLSFSSNPDHRDVGSCAQNRFGNEGDFLTTRVSYKFNLKGPSLNIQTACSTSLVAVHLACQSLLNGECDMALAGGVSIRALQKEGYFFLEGGIMSPDGHCRAFDTAARGTISGDGVGVVVLKRLKDALADADSIHAVIKGSAVNNDGSVKVGFTAPSVAGQAAVISEAMAVAGVEPESVTFIEAHGTGTPIGDPIEIEALSQAFRAGTLKKQFCALGSVKTNIGHLDAAAGVASLIKTVLALKHGLIPPSLHFQQPNPRIRLEESPFFVNTRLSEWKCDNSPRRAGVSSFGIGGTNAHVILEEAPAAEVSGESRGWELMVLSGKTGPAVAKATENLVEYLEQHPHESLADVAYTLQIGRRGFSHRRMLVCHDREDALTALKMTDPTRVFTGIRDSGDPGVVFMFPGHGGHRVNMASELYQTEFTFREQLDLCAVLLKSDLDVDLRDVLYPSPDKIEEASRNLIRPAVALPALFAIEHALSMLWMKWGVRPSAMIGYSLGEYAAACLAGVFSLADALTLVAARGRLMELAPGGSMMAVPLPAQELESLLGQDLDLAAVNGPFQSVVSGPSGAVRQLEQQLVDRGLTCRQLQTSYAFHSRMMDPIVGPFIDEVKRVSLNAPKIPYLSNVSGTWITAQEATDPNYWAQHLRQPVCFADGLRVLCGEPDTALLEMGPGQTLSSLVRQHPDKPPAHRVLSALPHARDATSDVAFSLNTLGQLWLAGVRVDWSGFHVHRHHRRIPLPTYPFERRRYWITGKPVPRSSPSSSHWREPNPLPADGNSCVAIHSRPNLTSAYVAPRTALEQRIADVWQQFFSFAQVGVSDNFFELGGDSLLAAQLIRRLAQTFRIELPLHGFFEVPTIAALAGLISEQSNGSGSPGARNSADVPSALSSPLVPIQPKGSRRPLFFVHPAGGTVFCYRSLAQLLGPDQPVYGFQARGLGANEQPFTRIEDMSAHYVQALTAFQPQPPYLLGGASLGGTVAFEMAQQLRAQGHKVALVALLDTPGPGQMPMTCEDEAAALAYMVGDNGALSLEHLRQLQTDEQIDYVLKNSRNFDMTGFSEPRRFLDLFMTNLQAMRNYVPRAYSDRLVFFLAKERGRFDPPHPELPWIDVASEGIEIHVLPGTHDTLFDSPSVQILVERLKHCLDTAASV